MENTIKLLLIAVVVCAVVVFTHYTYSPRASTTAKANGYILALYSNIESLERVREKSLNELITLHNSQTNINALLVQLIMESHIYSPVPVAHVAGTNVFVDALGSPYTITEVTNAASQGAFATAVEKRFKIISTSNESNRIR